MYNYKKSIFNTNQTLNFDGEKYTICFQEASFTNSSFSGFLLKGSAFHPARINTDLLISRFKSISAGVLPTEDSKIMCQKIPQDIVLWLKE